MTWFGKKKTPGGTTLVHHQSAERRRGFTGQLHWPLSIASRYIGDEAEKPSPSLIF